MLKYYELNANVDICDGDNPRFTIIDDELSNADNDEGIDFILFEDDLRRAKGVVCNASKKIPDWLWNGSGMLVSPAAHLIIQLLNTCRIRWVPTDIYSQKGKLLAEYMAAYDFERLDVCDYKRSDFNWIEGREPYTREGAGYLHFGALPVLDASKIPEALDLFFGEDIAWICSERMRNAIESEGLVGFEFNELEVY